VLTLALILALTLSLVKAFCLALHNLRLDEAVLLLVGFRHVPNTPDAAIASLLLLVYLF